MIKYFMVFYDGFTYIHKLLDFRRIGGESALSLGIYIGRLYTSHLPLGVGVISAFSAFSVAIHRGGFPPWCFFHLSGWFSSGGACITIIYKLFSKKYKKIIYI